MNYNNNNSYTITPRIYKPAECNDAASQLEIKTKKTL